MAPEATQFKIFISHTDSDHDVPEIRKFHLDQNTFENFSDKVQSLSKTAVFVIQYEDSDGDRISVENPEEFYNSILDQVWIVISWQ